MTLDRDNFSDSNDVESEEVFFAQLKEMKIQHASRYEKMALKLVSGGEEILTLSDGTYKFTVSGSSCAFSRKANDKEDFQAISWVKLTPVRDERILAIFDALAECEVRANLSI